MALDPGLSVLFENSIVCHVCFVVVGWLWLFCCGWFGCWRGLCFVSWFLAGRSGMVGIGFSTVLFLFFWTTDCFVGCLFFVGVWLFIGLILFLWRV